MIAGACIIITQTKEKSLYVNNKGNFILICRLADFLRIENIERSIHDINVAFSLIKEKISKEDITKFDNSKYSIIFPYHYTVAHWVLGNIELETLEYKLVRLEINIYIPLEKKYRKDLDDFKNKINQSIAVYFESKKGFELILNEELTSNGSSEILCGNISAEYGKGVIDGNITSKLNLTYNNIQDQHFQEINNNNNSNKDSSKNYFDNIPNFIPEPSYLLKITNELLKINRSYLLKITDELLKIHQNNNYNFNEMEEVNKWIIKFFNENKANEKYRDLLGLFFNEKKQILINAEVTLIESINQIKRYIRDFKPIFPQLQTPTKKSANRLIELMKDVKIESAKKQYPIGSKSFIEMITKKDAFVDKTLFIKELLEDSCDHFIITRPRRWGKSINMDMLKTFFNIEIEEDGEISEFEIDIKKKPFEKLKINNNYIDTKEITRRIILLNGEKLVTDLNTFEDIIKDMDNLEDKNSIIKKYKNDPNYRTEFQNSYILDYLKDLHEKFSSAPNLKEQICLYNETQANGNEQKMVNIFEEIRKSIEYQIIHWDKNCNKFKDIKNKFGIIGRHFGKYPVVFVTFSKLPNRDNLTLEEIKNEIAKDLRIAYQKYDYLYKKMLIKDCKNYNKYFIKDKIDLEDIQNLKIEVLENILKDRNYTLSNFSKLRKVTDDLSYSLYYLIEFVYENFNKKVILLIDEYDAPLNSCIEKPYYNDVLSVMNEVFKGLKDNNQIAKTVMTGILRLAKGAIFSG
jgi:hypothetical protein